ncbi:MAG: alpha/beta hydrolase [Bacteroidetes bacterium]|nr:alpha/beta hydrolase [Bacteroidota bacterium]
MKDRPDMRHILKFAKYPVMFIAGIDDKRIPSDRIEEHARLPLHSEFHLLENTGHMGFIEAKTETLGMCRNFTRKCLT